MTETPDTHANTDPAPLTCRYCSYNLTDLAPEGSCPECNTPIHLSIGWRDRARAPAVSSVVLAVLTLLGVPWLGLWPLPLWGWGLVLAAHALRTATPGPRSRPTRVTASIGLGLNAFLLAGALTLLALSLLRA